MLANTNMDWSSAAELISNLESLTPSQANYVQYSQNELALGNRVNESKCAYGSYYSNATIIAMSTWERAKSYTMCGMWADGRPKYCQEHRYCERCAYEKSRRIYNKYITAWRADGVYWYHVTYAFKNNLSLKNTTKEEYLGRWKEADDYFRQLYKDGVISGAIVTNELSIAGMAEQQLFPHTHAVVISDNPELTLEDIGGNVDLHIRAIDTEQYMLNCVKYPIKAINLKKTYTEELPNYPAETINIGVEMILARTTSWEKGHKKIKYIGRMNAMNPEYIGTKEVGKKKKQPNRKKKETLNKKKTSSKINSMDQKSQPSASTVLAKAATMLPQPTVPAPKKKTSPWLTGAAVGGGLLAADHFLNNGRFTAGGLNWLKDKFTSPATKNFQQQQLTAREALAGQYGRATALPSSDLAPRAINEGAVRSAVQAAKPVGMAAEGITGLPLLGTTLAQGLPKVFGWMGQAAGSPMTKAVGPLAAATGLAKYAPTAARVLGPVSTVTGTLSGHSLASNPLVEEGWAEPTKVWWNPASWGMNSGDTRNINNVRAGLQGVGALAGGTSGAAPMIAKNPLIKILGSMAAPIANAGVEAHEAGLRELQSEMDYKDQIKDHLMNLYEGARKGNVNSRQYLQRWLEARSTPERAGELKALSNDPIINNLIGRARNELFEAR